MKCCLFVLLFAAVVCGSVWADEAEKEAEKPKTDAPSLLERLKLDIGFVGITRYDYYSSSNEVGVLQDGALTRSELADTLWQKAAYVYADGRVGDVHASVLLNGMNEGGNPTCWFFVEFPPFAKMKKYINLKVGQFIKPFGRQARYFPYELQFGRYSQVFTHLFDGEAGFYDIGASLFGSYTLNLMKSCDVKMDYEVGIFNGEKMNTSDANDQKAVCARVALSFPKLQEKLGLDGLSVGFSFFDGGPRTMGDATFTEFDERQYIGADLCITLMKKRLSILAEYVKAVEDLFYIDSVSGVPTIEENRRTEGWYLEVGYFVWVNEKIDTSKLPVPQMRNRCFGLQIAALYDCLSLPTNLKMFSFTGAYHRNKNIYGLAVNYDIKWNIRFQVIYTRLDFGRYYSGLYEGVDDFAKNRITVQLSFIAF